MILLQTNDAPCSSAETPLPDIAAMTRRKPPSGARKRLELLPISQTTAYWPPRRKKIAGRAAATTTKPYSFFRLGAGATLRRPRPDRFVLRNADHTGDRLIDHVDDCVFDNRYAFALALFSVPFLPRSSLPAFLVPLALMPSCAQVWHLPFHVSRLSCASQDASLLWPWLSPVKDGPVNQFRSNPTHPTLSLSNSRRHFYRLPNAGGDFCCGSKSDIRPCRHHVCFTLISEH